MVPEPEFTPPRSLDAERGVLAGVLTEPEIAVEVFAILSADDFHDAKHGYIYRACLSLDSRNRFIDLVTVSEELERQKWLELSGGMEYLAGLAEDIPILASVKQYAEMVREKSMLRRLGAASRETIRDISEGSLMPAEIIDRAERRVFEIGEKMVSQDFISLDVLVKQGIMELEKLNEAGSSVTGLDTGFDKLNRKTSGFHAGELIIIAARPSVGKTTLALNMAMTIAGLGKGAVCFFSLEMAALQLIQRIICSDAGIGLDSVRGEMTKKAWMALTDSAERLSKLSFFVNDTPGLTSLELRARARHLRKRFGLSAVFVDYLQLMRGIGGEENRQQEIARISGELKAMAKDLEVPVIALSQLSRRAVSHEGPPRQPRLSDLRESGAIEQDADLVLFIHEDRADDGGDRGYDEQREVKLVIGKQRNGPRGEIAMDFLASKGKFLERAFD